MNEKGSFGYGLFYSIGAWAISHLKYWLVFVVNIFFFELN